MIGIVVVSHGQVAGELVNAARNIVGDGDAGPEPVGGVHETRGGAGVQAQPVHDAHLALDHDGFFSRISLAT